MKKSSNLVAFAPHERLLVDTGNLAVNQIALANEARIDVAHLSRPLNEFLVDWVPEGEDARLLELINWIAPSVVVGRRFDFRKAENAEAFLSELDDVRAIGADFKRVEYSGTTATEKTHNKGLTIRLDRDEYPTDSDKQRAVRRLIRRILRNDLRRAITALLAIDSDGTAKTWNNTTTADQDMREAIAAAHLTSGVFPNRAVIGLVAWNHRAKGLSAGESAGAFAGLNQSPTQVAQSLGLEDMKVSHELYQSSKTAKTRIMTSNVVFYYAEDGVGADDPTHIKRFVTQTQDGSLLRVFEHEVGPKFVDITVEHYSNVINTAGSIGAAKLNIT